MVDVGLSFIANGHAPIAGHPSEGALDVLLVAAAFLAAFDAAPGDAKCDATSVASVTSAPMIVGIVSMQLVESWAGTVALSADWLTASSWGSNETLLSTSSTVRRKAGGMPRR